VLLIDNFLFFIFIINKHFLIPVLFKSRKFGSAASRDLFADADGKIAFFEASVF